MITTLCANDIDDFRALVTRKLGLFFDDTKSDFLADVLRQRMTRFGCDHFAVYERRIAAMSSQDEEMRALAEQLTINETYFFRYAEHFKAFCEVVVPSRIRARGGDMTLRILSAGCSSGEEAYTLAMLLREHFPELAGWDVTIHGIDINSAVIEKATNARYANWSLRETPDAMLSKYFESSGRQVRVEKSIRAGVKFEHRNLAEDDALFWHSGAFDIVFCRNVTMYFTFDVTRRVIGRIASSLQPGGFLFLGHAETLRGVSNDFHLRHTHETFYYQRRESSDPQPDAGWTLANATQSVVYAPASDFSWSGPVAPSPIANSYPPEIAGSVSVSAAGATPALITTATPLRARAWDSTLALELLRKERFAEAKELLRALPADAAADADAQILLAVVLANGGELAEAERISRHVLTIDELNTGAHYLIALCRENDGDRDSAVTHNQAAVYLDPYFAMPHLHLGLIAKRSADAETAKRELKLALRLFDREDASRILLFGGGFTREALVEFCRAELRVCGGVA